MSRYFLLLLSCSDWEVDVAGKNMHEALPSCHTVSRQELTFKNVYLYEKKMYGHNV